MIPPIDVYIIDGHICTREVDYYLHLRAFHKYNIIPTLYMLSVWWLHIMGGLVHYVIRPGEVAQILMMTKNIATLGYTYVNHRINISPDLLYKLTHTGRIIAWIPSTLDWDLTI